MILLKKVPDNMKRHVVKVFDGEYDIPMKFSGSPNIVDIGANIGSFSVWAVTRWNAKVIAIEPNKANFEMLQINTAELGDKIGLINAAVRADKSNNKLYDGKNNCGECSFFKGKEQAETWTEVDIVLVSELPTEVDVVKIDTEGCEVEIVEELVKLKVFPKAFLMEYHSEPDRRKLESVLVPYYNLWGALTLDPGQGIVKYVLNTVKY